MSDFTTPVAIKTLAKQAMHEVLDEREKRVQSLARVVITPEMLAAGKRAIWKQLHGGKDGGVPDEWVYHAPLLKAIEAMVEVESKSAPASAEDCGMYAMKYQGYDRQLESAIAATAPVLTPEMRVLRALFAAGVTTPDQHIAAIKSLGYEVE